MKIGSFINDRSYFHFARQQSLSMRDCDWEGRLRPPESWFSLALNGIGLGMFIGAVIFFTCGI